MKTNIRINALLNAIKTVLGIVFPIITFPYIARVLNAEGVGIYNFSASIISYFSLLAMLGIPTYAIREGTQYRNDKRKISSFASQLFSINVISTCISYLLLFVIMVVLPKLHTYRGPILLLSLELLFTTIGCNWIFNIFEEFVYVSIRTIIVQLTSVFLMFVLVKKPSDLIVYLCIIVFCNGLTNIINYIYARKKLCDIKLTTAIEWKTHLRPILIIFSTSIAITIYVSADTTMIGFILDDYSVGVYSTAVKIYTLVKQVITAIMMVLIPRFSLLVSQDDRENINRLFSRVVNLLSVILIPAAIGLLFTSEQIIYVFAGIDFISGANSLKILCIAILFSQFAYMYIQCILIPNKCETKVFIATLISAIVNILLNLYFIKIWGINGAAITTVIAEFIVFILSAYYSRSLVETKGLLRNMISIGVGCVAIGAICILSKNYFSNPIISLAVSVVGASIAYFIILFLLKNPILHSEVDLILSKIRRQS